MRQTKKPILNYKLKFAPTLILVFSIFAEQILSRNFEINCFFATFLYIFVMLGFPISIISSLYFTYLSVKYLIQIQKENNNKQFFKISFFIFLSSIPILFLIFILLYIKYAPMRHHQPLR